ncbi:MAG: arginase family protein [Eubacteriales bacterium]
MKKTGIFYHPSFSQRSFLTVGRRLADFPSAISHILNLPHVVQYESRPVDDELLMLVHTGDLIREAGENSLCSTAWHSAGGVVQAVEEVAAGRLGNAFVFIGAGGHHAGRNYFWGYCCFNDVALAVTDARRKGLAKRFAVLDTDAHHGDGTREIFGKDKDFLHVCFCDGDYISEDGTNIDVDVSDLRGCGPERDRAYLSRVRSAFLPAVERFSPDLLIWYFGFDTHSGDYGSIGLTGDCYPLITALAMQAAWKVCGGRLVVVLGGGSRTDLATGIIPGIIERLTTGDMPSDK